MLCPALQRFALLLVTFGGFLELIGGVRGDYTGLPAYGGPVLILGLLVGLIGLAVAISPSGSE